MNVAVVIATYNQEQYIDEAIGSVFSQKLSDGDSVECIVTNDASTDSTAQHVEKWMEKYPGQMHYILQPRNVGTVRNTISAFRMICDNLDKYDYVAMLDGDDYWCDNYKLQKQIDKCAETNSVMAHTNYSILSSNGNMSKICHTLSEMPQGDVFSIAVQRPLFINCTIMFRASCLQKMDFVKIESMTELVAIDHLTNMIICSQGNVCFLEDITAVWRRHDNAQTNLNSIKKSFRWIEHECVQGRYLNQIFPNVVYFTEKEEIEHRATMQFRAYCSIQQWNNAKVLFDKYEFLAKESIAPFMGNELMFKIYFLRRKFYSLIKIISKRVWKY